MKTKMEINNTAQAEAKIMRIILTVFGAIGVLFIAIAVFAFFNEKTKQETYVVTTAEITGFNGDDYPYITYTVDGKEYENRLNYSSSSMKVGQQIKIAYDPHDPYSITTTGLSAYLLTLIFGFIGTVFVIISIAMIAINRRRKKQEEEQLGYDPSLFE